jgi:hypothetical protein
MESKMGKEENGGILIEGCIIDVTQTKNIVTANIIDFNGTVKEFINNGDFAITIRGYLSSDYPDVYPKDQVAILEQYLMAPVSLSIISKFLNDIFLINEIVVTSFNLFQQQGLRNIQYFEINALSDFNFQIVSSINE